MSYNDEDVLADDNLKEDDGLLDPLADEAINDFRFDEDTDEDTDDSFH